MRPTQIVPFFSGAMVSVAEIETTMLNRENDPCRVYDPQNRYRKNNWLHNAYRYKIYS